MRQKLIFRIFFLFLVLCVAVGSLYLRNTKKRMDQENQWKIRAAFQELDLVFPTSFKSGKGPQPPEPDLAKVVETLNTTLSRSQPRRLEKDGNEVRSIPYEPMRFRAGRPDAQWQMALTYEKETRKVKAEAYGIDLSAPVSTREYPCCRW